MPADGKARGAVVVGLSGGVDSAVAAALLRDQGYEVRALFLQLPVFGGSDNAAARDAAQRVSEHLGVPLEQMDAREPFERNVLEEFADAYAQGRTPNPCVRCNDRVKFRLMIQHAEQVGARRVATGHYARIVKPDGTERPMLARGRQGDDQSYFLYALGQSVLSRALLPLGDMHKSDVRALAADLHLPVSQRPDSQDLCFLAGGHYREFLWDRRPDAFRPGPIVHVSGRVLGEHEGIACYTIGQRRGLGIAHSEPLYVVELDPQKNTVVVGEREHVLRAEMTLRQVHWMASRPQDGPLSARVKIRYNHPGAPARVETTGRQRVRVRFAEPQEAPCPGQAAVFYRGDVVLGGGVIDQVAERNT
ncbi:MAG: tRNA 2-thiouridine(34) synthase MnmA [Candidatus Brocadiia bacterium]